MLRWLKKVRKAAAQHPSSCLSAILLVIPRRAGNQPITATQWTWHNVEMVMRVDRIRYERELIAVAIEQGMRFAFARRPHIGAGVVSKSWLERRFDRCGGGANEHLPTKDQLTGPMSLGRVRFLDTGVFALNTGFPSDVGGSLLDKLMDPVPIRSPRLKTFDVLNGSLSISLPCPPPSLADKSAFRLKRLTPHGDLLLRQDLEPPSHRRHGDWTDPL